MSLHLFQNGIIDINRKQRTVKMKPCMFIFCFFVASSFAHSQITRQDDEQSLQESAARLIGPDELREKGDRVILGAERTVELDLRTFHSSIQSFVSVLQTEKRVAGRGWSIDKSDYLDWKNAIDKAVSRRLELVQESKGMKVASDDFWKKVVESEVAAEKELGEMLQRVLPPDQQDNFLIEHSKDLGVSILTSMIFRDKAKLEPKTFETLQQTRKSSFALQVGAISGKPIPPGKFLAFQRAFIACLTPEQFDVLLVLTGRKDSDTSLEEHMSSRVALAEREHLLEAIPALKKYVKTAASK